MNASRGCGACCRLGCYAADGGGAEEIGGADKIVGVPLKGVKVNV